MFHPSNRIPLLHCEPSLCPNPLGAGRILRFSIIQMLHCPQTLVLQSLHSNLLLDGAISGGEALRFLVGTTGLQRWRGVVIVVEGPRDR